VLLTLVDGICLLETTRLPAIKHYWGDYKGMKVERKRVVGLVAWSVVLVLIAGGIAACGLVLGNLIVDNNVANDGSDSSSSSTHALATSPTSSSPSRFPTAAPNLRPTILSVSTKVIDYPATSDSPSESPSDAPSDSPSDAPSDSPSGGYTALPSSSSISAVWSYDP